MSFGFRDKDRPSLRDRFRGKSGDQILEELRKKLDKDKEMFFERAPNPPSFRRAGFPFDDDGLTSRGRPDFRHRLEELAQQHPEFADSLRPWYEQQQQQSPQHAAGDAGWGFRQRTGSNTSQSHPEPQQQQHPPPQQQQQQPEAKCEQQQQQPQQQQPQPGLAHHGLRNTVDLGEAKAQAEAQGAQAMDGQGQDERGKRAQSAPPAPEQAGHGGHPQRFVSRLDINPQPTAAAGQQASQDPAAAKPPSGPKPQPQAAKAGSSSSNVRQIPIFVEGRDEPVMAKDEVDSSAANFGQGFTHHPPPRSGFGQPFSRHNMGFPSWREQNQEREAPQQKRPFPQQQPQPPTRQQYQQPQQQQQPPQQQHHQPPPQKQQPPRQQTPPQQPAPQQPPPPSKPKDALDKVQDVRIEVESLSKQVDEFVGTAKDKAYIFLDEMLTRELIKLDVIEAEGRDDVRQARKDTIRFIQQCISRLEAKAAQPAAAAPAEAMDVDPAAASQSDKTEGAEAAPEAAAQAEASPSSAAESQPAAPAQPAEAAAAPSQPDAVPAPSPAPSTATGNADTTQAPPAATS